MKPITQEWLNLAKDDLDTAQQILHLPHLTNMVAFHAQQAIEKTFKAILEQHNSPPRLKEACRNPRASLFLDSAPPAPR